MLSRYAGYSYRNNVKLNNAEVSIDRENKNQLQPGS